MRKYKKYTDKDRLDAVSMYLVERKCSLEQIGKVFKVTGATVSRWVDERLRMVEG